MVPMVLIMPVNIQIYPMCRVPGKYGGWGRTAQGRRIPLRQGFGRTSKSGRPARFAKAVEPRPMATRRAEPVDAVDHGALQEGRRKFLPGLDHQPGDPAIGQALYGGRQIAAVFQPCRGDFCWGRQRRVLSKTMRTGERSSSPGRRQVSSGSSASTVPMPVAMAS